MVRMSADERRAAVIDAALIEFSHAGYAGTTTQAIADRVGVSQPYLFRLFPSKKALFLAAIERCWQRITQVFSDAVGDRVGDDALEAIGGAYIDLIADRDLLRFQLQMWAASDDPELRAAARGGFESVWRTAERLTGASDEAVTKFFATGMLLNVGAALEIPDAVCERWADLLD